VTLIPPHGKQIGLKPRMVIGEQLAAEKKKALTLPQIMMTSRETSDLIMLGIGAFTPLEGFMNRADWKSVCETLQMVDGVFWPIPITLSTTAEEAAALAEGHSAALVDSETGELMGSILVEEKYSIDKEYECREIFKTADVNHPGVAKVMAQGEVNIAGRVQVFSESYYPETYGNVYLRPWETRQIFEQKGWETVAALQLRNPMHRSHEYIAKIAIETCDGVLIHQLVGKLKPGDIPAEVRVRAVDTLVENYFVKDTCVQAGYPMEMRYGGPREALLHAAFRQNFGCSHLIVGRDHAGVGDYYGPFDSQRIFDEIPDGSLQIQPLRIDWTFYCKRCDGMASMKTCPHGADDRMIVSGTMLRKWLSSSARIPEHFSRPEVIEILRDYYSTLNEKIEIHLHRYATGEQKG
jgi:sulfate adenylyltransferase